MTRLTDSDIKDCARVSTDLVNVIKKGHMLKSKLRAWFACDSVSVES